MAEPLAGDENIKPLVSIIVPVYNTGEALRPCFDSLLKQTVRSYEIIIVNDGSTDDSPEICEEYAKKNPGKIVYISGPNGGVSSARNKGLDVARGEWIGFCDSDDLTDPDLYRTLYDNALINHADLSCCAMLDKGPAEERAVLNFPELGNIVLRDKKEIMKHCFFPFLLKSSIVHGGNVICLFKNQIISEKKIHFESGVSVFEDELFLMEYLIETNSLVVCDRVLYTYLHQRQSAYTSYYTKAHSDFVREQNWYLRCCGHLRIFLKGGLEKEYSQLYSSLWIRKLYHHVQMLCSNEKKSFFPKIKQIRNLASHEEYRNFPAASNIKLLIFIIKYLHFLLPFVCFIKHKSDELKRKF